MELHQIRYFLAVSDTLNFTRAAEICNVTQPALSRAIQQLEGEIGGPLFRRERKLTHLTDLGLLIRPQLHRIVESLSAAKREAGTFLAPGKPQLRVGIMCTVGPTRFTGLMSDFQMRCPDVALRIVEGTPAVLTVKLEQGEIDLALMASATGFSERFKVRPLYRERFLIACPAGHRFAKMSAVPISDVNNENYLLRINCEYRNAISELLQQSGSAVHICYRSEREDWIQNMVAAGLGICFIPEFTALLPGLVLRPVIEPELWRDISLVAMGEESLGIPAARFVKAASNYPWPASLYAT
jgi:LysR family transcriptional regulator, hydrogen peroxide-inducible genes activator